MRICSFTLRFRSMTSLPGGRWA